MNAIDAIEARRRIEAGQATADQRDQDAIRFDPSGVGRQANKRADHNRRAGHPARRASLIDPMTALREE